MLFSLFSKMRSNIEEKIRQKEPGLYIALVFPIFVAFILTFAVARVIGYLIVLGYIPLIEWQTRSGIHVHHFTYGFFILAIAGYLSLVFNGPRAKYLIALLLGGGLGLAMDEFGFWLHLSDANVARWNYDGFVIVIASLLILLTARPGSLLLRKLWPGAKKIDSKQAEIEEELLDLSQNLEESKA